jgi:hypothetical protein
MLRFRRGEQVSAEHAETRHDFNSCHRRTEELLPRAIFEEDFPVFLSDHCALLFDIFLFNLNWSERPIWSQSIPDVANPNPSVLSFSLLLFLFVRFV